MQITERLIIPVVLDLANKIYKYPKNHLANFKDNQINKKYTLKSVCFLCPQDVFLSDRNPSGISFQPKSILPFRLLSPYLR